MSNIGYIVFEKEKVLCPSGVVKERLADHIPYFQRDKPLGRRVYKQNFKGLVSDNPNELHYEKSQIQEINENIIHVIKSHKQAIKYGDCPICGHNQISSIEFVKGLFVCCKCRKSVGEFAVKQGDKIEYLPKVEGYKTIQEEPKIVKKLIERRESFKISEQIKGGSIEEHCALKELERLNKQMKFGSGFYVKRKIR